MNLAGVISSLATGTYTVTRHAAGSVANGRYSDGSSSTITITASVQPAKGRDLQILPEGLRTSETLAVYTATALRTASAPAGVGADLIAIGSDTFQVLHVENWGPAGAYYKALATKVGQ